jgi:hypothetical protein
VTGGRLHWHKLNRTGRPPATPRSARERTPPSGSLAAAVSPGWRRSQAGRRGRISCRITFALARDVIHQRGRCQAQAATSRLASAFDRQHRRTSRGVSVLVDRYDERLDGTVVGAGRRRGAGGRRHSLGARSRR